MRAVHLRPAPALGATDLQRILAGVARVAGQVSDTAAAASGATPAVSTLYRYRWPLVIGGSILAGVILTRIMAPARRRG